MSRDVHGDNVATAPGAQTERVRSAGNRRRLGAWGYLMAMGQPAAALEELRKCERVGR